MGDEWIWGSQLQVSDPFLVSYLLWGRNIWTCGYSPLSPEAYRIGEDYTLICMACNKLQEVMDRIIANNDECRDSLNNPKPMRMEPSWFRSGLRGMSKGFPPDLQEDSGWLALLIDFGYVCKCDKFYKSWCIYLWHATPRLPFPHTSQSSSIAQ